MNVAPRPKARVTELQTYIVDIADLAVIYTQGIDELLKRFKELEPSLINFGFDEARVLIRAMFKDTITSGFRWCTGHEYYEKAVARMFPWINQSVTYQDDVVYVYREVFVQYVEEYFFMEYVRTVEAITARSNAWSVWELKEHGRQTFMLVNHGDYRILDWQKRYEAGEIPLNGQWLLPEDDVTDDVPAGKEIWQHPISY